MKRWLYIGGVLLVLIIIGIYFLYSSLDSIIKAAVERIGSDATQAQVRLNDVDIELTSGKGALRGLTVGNPSGFKAARALSLGEISLLVDVGSITGDTVLIKEIVIAAPEVTYEFGTKGSNIDALRRNVNAYAGNGKSKGKAEKSPADSKEDGKKLIVEHLYVRKGNVIVSAPELQGQTVAAALPDIHLTNIGKAKGGATAAELAQQVLAAIGQNAAKVAASPDISKLIGSAKGGVVGIPGAAGESAKGAGEGVKQLFGK